MTSADPREDTSAARPGARGRGAAESTSADPREDTSAARPGARGRGAAESTSADPREDTTSSTDLTEQVFTLPDLGEGLTEAEIVEWLVADGDEVGIDQHVVVVETAKAAVEVPCPYAGRVVKRHGEQGDTLEVGRPLITIGSDSPIAEPTSPIAEPTSPIAERTSPSVEPVETSGAVLIGYGTGGERPRRHRGRKAAKASSAQPAADSPSVAANANTLAPRVISPVVRSLIAEHGLRLADLRPAFGDVVRRADVEAALAQRQADATPQPMNQTRAVAYGTTDERIPLTGLRRTIADKLATSRREIPDATTWVDVDATGLVEARAAFKASGRDSVTLLALLARFCVAALQRFPELNASVEGSEIVRHGRISLGFAAQSPRGLVVPVVHDAGRMTTAQLAQALAELTVKAREGTLSPAELTGGTFTLNNYGVFGVDGSTPIINHPEAAMLGVGRIIDRPWVVDGALAVRKVTQLGFTFDHRVCDGGSAGGFLRYVADLVERPTLLIDSL